MIIIILFSILLSSLSSLNLLSLFSKIGLPLQTSCENLAPLPLIHKSMQRSLLCGTPLSAHRLSSFLERQSLIHLFVVSGGHFLFLEKILKTLRCPSVLGTLLLFVYNLITGFQPPGTRSILQMILSRYQHFELREDQLQFLSGLILLVFFPELGKSVSFLLSWTAALALSLANFFFYSSSGVRKVFWCQLLISIILFPWLWTFGNGHPLGILSNLILGPIIVFILFPLSFLVILFSPLTWMFDQVAFLFTFLVMQSNEVFSTTSPQKINLTFFWLYLFGLHLFFHFYQVQYWRRAS